MANEHISTYLDTYLSKQALGAVLIAGKWGAGKTYAVRRYLRENSNAHVYVSVNGARDTDELRRRFVYAAYPALGNKAFRALGSLARSALGIVRFKTDLDIDTLIDLNGVDTFVVDDLERATIPIDELLGFLNSFVEDDQKHMIILGNEEELVLKPNYSRIKEKTVEFTLAIQPDVTGAFSALQASVSPEYWRALSELQVEITSLFKETESDNLRVLRQSVIEFEEVYIFLRTLLKADVHEIPNFIKLFLALSFAYKLNEISRKDIERRQVDDFARYFAKEREAHEKDAMERLDDRHSTLNIYSDIIDNEYLARKICDGIHDPLLLERTVNDVRARSDPLASPEWRNLWHYMTNPEDVTLKSYEIFSAKFSSQQYSDPGVILHAFGIMFEMQKVGLFKETRRKTLAACIAYIDALLASDRLPELNSDYSTGFAHGAAHGLGFMSNDDPLFRKAWAYYITASGKSRAKRMLARLHRIVESLCSSADKFTELLLQGRDQEHCYGTPILHHLDPIAFCKKIMMCDGSVQWEILQTLGARYDSNPYPEVLETELPWLKRLRRELSQSARSAGGFTEARLRKLIEWHFPEVARAAKAKKAAPETPAVG